MIYKRGKRWRVIVYAGRDPMAMVGRAHGMTTWHTS
jgi:hypothetical protein